MHSAAKTILRNIATLGPVGFFPIASGTAGTLVIFLVLAVTNMPLWLHLVLTAAVFAIGVIASEAAAEVAGEDDPSCVVVDEVAGFMVAVVFLPDTFGYLVAAFFIFRLFDIVKPPPVNRLEELHGGMGIMMDDIMAGIYTNFVLQVWRVLM